MKSYIVVSFLSAACWLSSASDTNKFYITDEGFLSLNHAQKLEEAKKTRESLPAEDFPEGNWGAITNGFQLSMRFDKQVFTNGEPIIATILLRNTSNEVLTYMVSYVAGMDGPIDLAVTSETGESVPPIRIGEIDIVSARGRAVAPNTQHRYQERLDKRFDLKTNGTYIVCARHAVGYPKPVEVTSAKVRIKVEN